MRYTFFMIFSLLSLAACDKKYAPEPNINEPAKATLSSQDGTYCFSKVWNKDITEVQLTIMGDAITGSMNWLPHEKDSARGTLKGNKNAAGEFDLMYDYMIEGSQQTETKIMKIEDGKLLLKVGELLDPKYDGNLIYKDVGLAKYSEILDKIDCKSK